jgi:hypothetical protein
MKMDFRLYFLLISLFTQNAFGCYLNQKVISLSGPITMTLEYLGLTKDKNLVAISKFHKLSHKFEGEVLAGGIFLAKRTLDKYKEGMIFFDKSKDLSREFKQAGFQNSIEIYTLGQNPFQTVKYTVSALRSILTNCDSKIAELKSFLKKTKQNLKIPKGTYYFFLGKITQKYPELIIANDGFLRSLKALDSFATYKTDLNYVPWSKKLIGQGDRYFKIGLFESEKNQVYREKNKKGFWNLSGRGLLIPGIRQVILLEFLSSKDKF